MFVIVGIVFEIERITQSIVVAVGGVAAVVVADSGDEVGALFLEVRQIGAGASLGMERRAPNQSGLDVTVVTEAAREA